MAVMLSLGTHEGRVHAVSKVTEESKGTTKIWSVNGIRNIYKKLELKPKQPGKRRKEKREKKKKNRLPLLPPVSEVLSVGWIGIEPSS